MVVVGKAAVRLEALVEVALLLLSTMPPFRMLTLSADRTAVIVTTLN